MKPGLRGEAIRTAVAALAAISIGTCGRPGGTGPAGGSSGPPYRVVLIVVDTERADFTGPYGARLPTTPWLDEIAREGVTFENAFAPSSWTVPSMFSMFTGLWPGQHGMTSGEIKGRGVVGQPVLPDGATTLTELVHAGGWETFGVCTNFHLSDRFGFTQGFDRVVGSDFAKLPFPDMAVRSIAHEVRASDRSFVWIHYLDPHGPYRLETPWFGEWNDSGIRSYPDFMGTVAMDMYRRKHGLPEGAPLDPADVEKVFAAMQKAALGPWKFMEKLKETGFRPPEEWLRFTRAAYASEIRVTDEAMREAVRTLGDEDRTIVIVTSDHGEEIFERGAIGHRSNHSLYQELLHVPLVIRLPGGRGAGVKIEEPVSLVDVMPTILDLLGIDAPGGLAGRSLVPLIDGKGTPGDRPLYAELTDVDGNVTRCIVEYPWKYVHDFTHGIGLLYRLDDDPGETRDLSGVDAARAESMRAALIEWTRKTVPVLEPAMPTILSPEDVERLEALGYMQ